MKVGDLITYNAGGMRGKTLGLVLASDFHRGWNGPQKTIYLIQWCVAGKYMPRRENNQKDPVTQQWNWEAPKSGELAWHSNEGNWFEVVE